VKRDDAIAHLLDVGSRWRHEFCIGDRELADAKLELHDALRSLGVTDKEIKENS
jgi:hypothetical protein